MKTATQPAVELVSTEHCRHLMEPTEVSAHWQRFLCRQCQLSAPVLLTQCELTACVDEEHRALSTPTSHIATW